MADTGFKNPTAEGEDFNQWSFGQNMFSDNNQDSWVSTLGWQNDLYDFDFGIPGGATIVGIEVVAKGKSSRVNSWKDLGIELSWDGGANYTTAGKTCRYTTWIYQYETFGGAADLWGRVWAIDDFSNANFRLKVKYEAQQEVFGDLRVDHVKIKVYYTIAAGGRVFSCII